MTSDWLKCSADLPGTPLCNLPVGTGHLFFLNQVSEMLFLSLAVEELRKLPSRRLVGTSRVVVKELLGITFFLSKSVSYSVHPELFQQQSFTPVDLAAA